MFQLVVRVMVGAWLFIPVLAFAAPAEVALSIKDHKFQPTQLTIPSNTKVKIIVENQDPTPEEFESVELNREKVVTGHNKIVVFIGPLKPGKYKFFGDFHKDTAQGEVIVQ